MTESTAEAKTEPPEFRTRICLEEPNPQNPYLTQARYYCGYSNQELWRHSRFIDAIILNFTGNLPEPAHSQAFEMMFIGLMNLGPRDPAIRSAMTAGITKSLPEHLLPIGLLANDGPQGGAAEVTLAHHTIRRHRRRPAELCIQKLKHEENFLIPGFGQLYGSVDPIIEKLFFDIASVLPSSKTLNWCSDLLMQLKPFERGIKSTGVVAALCLELGIGARESLGVYQLATSVGIVAQGIEQSHFSFGSAPFLSDDQYEYQHE